MYFILIILKLENFELNEEKCNIGLSRSNDENSAGSYRSNENLEKSLKDDCPHFKGKEFFKLFEKIEDQSKINLIILNLQKLIFLVSN